jgi:hypothetical protein
MTAEFDRFVQDLTVDPRHHLTKKLLDAIAAVWRGETRLRSVCLDFVADESLMGEGAVNPAMTWVAYPHQQREDFNEFARLYLTPHEGEPEYTAEERVEFAQIEVTYAHDQLALAQKRLAKAQAKVSPAAQDFMRTTVEAKSTIAQLREDLGDA